MLTFNKNQAFPTQATITVLAPLGGTAWNVTGICPDNQKGSLVEVGEGNCSTIPSTWDDVYIDTLTPQTYTPANGDIVYTDIINGIRYNGGGDTYRMRVTNSPFQTILDYSFTIDANGLIGNVLACSITPTKNVSLSQDFSVIPIVPCNGSVGVSFIAHLNFTPQNSTGTLTKQNATVDFNTGAVTPIGSPIVENIPNLTGGANNLCIETPNTISNHWYLTLTVDGIDSNDRPLSGGSLPFNLIF